MFAQIPPGMLKAIENEAKNETSTLPNFAKIL